MRNLFTYGTLMCEDILHEVSGHHLSNEPATLKGYRRRSVIGENYPAITPDRQGCVDGIVYRNLPNSVWDRLDRFEGEMYVRQQVAVELDDGTPLFAETYIIHPDYLDRLGRSDWDFDDFVRNGKASFQRHYKGYQSL